MYFPFDLEREDLEKIIKIYEEKILRGRIRNQKIFLFLDEIHKLKDWENKIKVLYDLNLKIKLVLSGSASLNLMRQSRESLAGRVRYNYLPPLTFREFIEFSGNRIPDREDYEIHRRKLNILLNEFVLRGFPETLKMTDKKAKEYVRELVVERIIYRDISESFRIEDVEIIRILAEYIFENPGVILNVDALSRDLKRHKKTIRNALNYLELSLLIKRVSNLRKSYLSTSRKNKKGYPLHASLSTSDNEDKNLETLIRSEINAEHYWREGRYEVDFVKKEDRKIIPVEVKNKEKLDKNDFKSISKFLGVFGADKGYIIYRGGEEYTVSETITVLPVTKLLLAEYL